MAFAEEREKRLHITEQPAFSSGMRELFDDDGDDLIRRVDGPHEHLRVPLVAALPELQWAVAVLLAELERAEVGALPELKWHFSRKRWEMCKGGSSQSSLISFEHIFFAGIEGPEGHWKFNSGYSQLLFRPLPPTQHLLMSRMGASSSFSPIKRADMTGWEHGKSDRQL